METFGAQGGMKLRGLVDVSENEVEISGLEYEKNYRHKQTKLRYNKQLNVYFGQSFFPKSENRELIQRQ